MLLGGDGDDVLIGHRGRDLLLGGFGEDRLVGNAGEDLLIAGTSDFEADWEALGAILAEWASRRSYAERIANLTGDGAGDTFDQRLNGDAFLTTTGEQATVHDDGDVDRLTGGGGRDWFLANLGGGANDVVTDEGRFERADDLLLD